MADLDALSPFIARPASLVYRAASALHRAAYDRGWRRIERLPVPVVSVGNLEVGGTGKTPAVAALAQAALRAGLRPAILTRGYGGSGRSGVLRNGAWTSGTPGAATSKSVDASGVATAGVAGDEPHLLSRALPSVPVVVGKRRAENARALLAAGERVDLFLLDDGFQHRALARQSDLVLLDARRPFGNGRLLPAGPLREPPSALRRAHHLLLTGASPRESISDGVARLLDRAAPEAPRSRAWVEAGGLSSLGDACAPAPELRGLSVHAVAAIARPERFRTSLEREGARVAKWSVFRDHHRFSADEARALERAAREEGHVLVTTAKDAVRLVPLQVPGSAWWVFSIALEVEGGWDALLAGLLGGTPAGLPASR
jgi:tetraacyldisaccharide 4'-kinase